MGLGPIQLNEIYFQLIYTGLVLIITHKAPTLEKSDLLPKAQHNIMIHVQKKMQL